MGVRGGHKPHLPPPVFLHVCCPSSLLLLSQMRGDSCCQHLLSSTHTISSALSSVKNSFQSVTSVQRVHSLLSSPQTFVFSFSFSYVLRQTDKLLSVTLPPHQSPWRKTLFLPHRTQQLLVHCCPRGHHCVAQTSSNELVKSQNNTLES